MQANFFPQHITKLDPPGACERVSATYEARAKPKHCDGLCELWEPEPHSVTRHASKPSVQGRHAATAEPPIPKACGACIWASRQCQEDVARASWRYP